MLNNLEMQLPDRHCSTLSSLEDTKKGTWVKLESIKGRKPGKTGVSDAEPS